MRRACLVVLALAFSLMTPDPSGAFSVSIANASFEQYALSEGGYTTWGTGLIGWSWQNPTRDFGVWRPLPGRYLDDIPDGSNVAYSHGPVIYQVLDHRLAANTLYELRVDVGDPGSFGGYSLELCADGVPLSGITSLPTPEWRRFVEASIRYEVDSDDPLIGQRMEIRLRSFGIEVDFDNVRLDANPLTEVPEPGTMALLGGALVGLLLDRRRRSGRGPQVRS